MRVDRVEDGLSIEIAAIGGIIFSLTFIRVLY